jgi:hypothetical protein
MPKKPKFNPEVTRVKLNPEQAVLNCSCYSGNVIIVNRGGVIAGMAYGCWMGGGNKYWDSRVWVCGAEGGGTNYSADPQYAAS